MLTFQIQNGKTEDVNVRKGLMWLECSVFAMVLLFMENVTVVLIVQILNGTTELVNVFKDSQIITENASPTLLAMTILPRVVWEPTSITNKENV